MFGRYVEGGYVREHLGVTGGFVAFHFVPILSASASAARNLPRKFSSALRFGFDEGVAFTYNYRYSGAHPAAFL